MEKTKVKLLMILGILKETDEHHPQTLFLRPFEKGAR
jgi:hypothetical protein